MPVVFNFRPFCNYIAYTGKYLVNPVLTIDKGCRLPKSNGL